MATVTSASRVPTGASTSPCCSISPPPRASLVTQGLKGRRPSQSLRSSSSSLQAHGLGSFSEPSFGRRFGRGRGRRVGIFASVDESVKDLPVASDGSKAPDSEAKSSGAPAGNSEAGRLSSRVGDTKPGSPFDRVVDLKPKGPLPPTGDAGDSKPGSGVSKPKSPFTQSGDSKPAFTQAGASKPKSPFTESGGLKAGSAFTQSGASKPKSPFTESGGLKAGSSFTQSGSSKPKSSFTQSGDLKPGSPFTGASKPKSFTQSGDSKPGSTGTKAGASKPAIPENPFRKAPLLPPDWEKAGARAAGSGKRVLDAFRAGDKEGTTTKFGQPLVPSNIFDEVRRTPEEIAADAFKFEINPGQLLLIGSFVLIAGLMFATVFLVWKVGGIHYNEY